MKYLTNLNILIAAIIAGILAALFGDPLVGKIGLSLYTGVTIGVAAWLGGMWLKAKAGR